MCASLTLVASCSQPRSTQYNFYRIKREVEPGMLIFIELNCITVDFLRIKSCKK